MNNLEKMIHLYGPLMHSRDIWQALRFRSADSLRSARYRGRLKLNMFPIAGRRGLFAHTEDVAALMDSFGAGGAASDVNTDQAQATTQKP